MNKKGFLGYLVSAIVFLSILLIAIPITYKETKQNFAYHSFCDTRPSFCYCGIISCEFRTLRTEKYTNGELISNEFSNDTLALCDLAKELKDKKTIYKVGCE